MRARRRSDHRYGAGLDGAAFVVGIAYATFFIARYRGLWTEGDTASFSHNAMRLVVTGSIFFSRQYPHGFGYQAWLAALSVVTGLPVSVLNTVVLPVVGMAMVLAASLVTYRTLLPEPRAAYASSLALLAVPAVTFTVLRGNHEKLNIACFLLVIVCLVRLGESPASRRVAWLVLMFLLAVLNAITNDYFGLLMALVLTFVWFWTFVSRRGLRHVASRPSHWIGLACLGAWTALALAVLAYPPAHADLRLVQTLAKYMGELLMRGRHVTNPIAVADSQWAGPWVAQVVGITRWALLGLSSIMWCVFAGQWWRGRVQLSWALWLLLVLYGAFTLSVLVAVPIDLSGLHVGNNLEVRNFTYLALVAIPLVIWGTIRRSDGQRGHKVVWISALAIAAFVVIGELNITADPLVSDQWVGYTAAEQQMVLYFLNHRQSGYAWGGPDTRILDVGVSNTPLSPWSIVAGRIGKRPNEVFFLDSPAIRASAAVAGESLPKFSSLDRVYDDGGAAIYLIPPNSPYQP